MGIGDWGLGIGVLGVVVVGPDPTHHKPNQQTHTHQKKNLKI